MIDKSLICVCVFLVKMHIWYLYHFEKESILLVGTTIAIFLMVARIAFDKRVTTIKINSSNWHVQIKWNNGKNSLAHSRTIHWCVKMEGRTIALGPNGKSNEQFFHRTERKKKEENLINSFSRGPAISTLAHGIKYKNNNNKKIYIDKRELPRRMSKETFWIFKY